MGFLFGSRAAAPQQARGVLQDVGVPSRMTAAPGQPATPERAMRFSAVWAALRLRADLISTLPIDIFRRTATGQVPAPDTLLFRRPAAGLLFHEWLYATQMDLDRYGNCFGQIVARQDGYPTQVELWPASEVAVQLDGRLITGYRYRGTVFSPFDVWHERQYMPAGYPVGLSPLAYAAWAIGGGVAAQEFGLDFYASGAHPTGVLRNTEEAVLDPEVLDTAKARFKVATANRDIFATGRQWEFTPVQVDANSAQFLAAMDHSAVDVARFIGVPATAIDAAVSGQSVTYANLTQQQLNLLVNFLNAPIVRRELAFTWNALPQPRFAKFNTDALLRLDPTGRTDLLVKEIDARLLAVDEGRELLNRPPLTPEQVDQFAVLFPKESASQEVTT